MRILVTRPREESERFAQRLRALGHGVLVEPMLDIVPAADAAIDLAGVQALLFTSANGVHVFAAREARRDLPVFAVGDASAAAARDAGFARVESAGGDVGDLARLVVAKLGPADGALAHLGGAAVAGDLAGALGAAGFEVRRFVLYRAEPASALSDATRRALAAGEVDVATFFSPRSAETFVSLAREAGLADALARVSLVGLSANVIEAARGVPWRTRIAAEHPSEDALIEALGRVLAALPAAPVAPAAAAPGQLVPGLALAIAVAALLAASWVLFAPAPDPAALVEARVGTIEPRLRAAGAAIEEARGEAARTAGALERRLGELGGRLDEAVRRLDDAARRLDAIEARPAAESPPRQDASAEIAALQRRLAALEDVAARAAPRSAGEAAAAAAELRRLAEELARLQEAVGSLALAPERPSAPMEMPRLDLGALAAAVARGAPFAAELQPVAAALAEDSAARPALDGLGGLAARGVTAIDRLRAEFATAAVAAIRAERVAGSQGWWRAFQERIAAVATVRPVGEIAGEDTPARLARAETRLARSDLAGALAELNGLGPAAAEALSAWRRAASDRLAADGWLAALAERARSAP